MAINTETQINASVVLGRVVYEKLKAVPRKINGAFLRRLRFGWKGSLLRSLVRIPVNPIKETDVMATGIPL